MYPDGNIKIHLITGKSRNVPLKVVSLLRFDLPAAYLLADLFTFMKKSYEWSK